MKCPLCKSSSSVPLLEFKEKHYFKCQKCDLRFLGEQYYLKKQEEVS